MASFKDFIARFKSALSKNKAAVTVLETPDIETIASEFPNVDANNYATVSDKMYTILFMYDKHFSTSSHPRIEDT
ncbi:hypothetical protein B0O80DRAFT_504718 [Mortierella sp. GBAus27b]|nr:hypothetical protein B0O80DRAFT_504718 [Mortierella sp. GBAus27b]